MSALLKPLPVLPLPSLPLPSLTKTGEDRIDGWFSRRIGIGRRDGQTADQETHPGNRTNWRTLSYTNIYRVTMVNQIKLK